MPESALSTVDTEAPPFVVDPRHDAAFACARELDIAVVSDLRAGFVAAAAQRAEQVVLDRREVTFLDCRAVDDIVDVWCFACLTSPGQAGALIFPDPADLVSRIASAVRDCARTVPPWMLAEISQTCTSLDVADSVIEALVAASLGTLVDIDLVDPLTGMLNRRDPDLDLVQLLATSRRRRHFLTVVMIEVEGLKAVNDQLGHAAGDDLLCTLAANLTATSRVGDRAYRVGGDFERADRRTPEFRDLIGQIADGDRRHVVVDQATGMLAQHFGAAMDDVSDILDSLAQSRGEAVEITAAHLVDGMPQPASIAVPDTGDAASVDAARVDSSEFSGTTGGQRGS